MKRFFLAIAAEITSAEGGPREGREGEFESFGLSGGERGGAQTYPRSGLRSRTAALDRRSLKKA